MYGACAIMNPGKIMDAFSWAYVGYVLLFGFGMSRNRYPWKWSTSQVVMFSGTALIFALVSARFVVQDVGGIVRVTMDNNSRHLLMESLASFAGCISLVVLAFRCYDLMGQPPALMFAFALLTTLDVGVRIAVISSRARIPADFAAWTQNATNEVMGTFALWSWWSFIAHTGLVSVITSYRCTDALLCGRDKVVQILAESSLVGWVGFCLAILSQAASAVQTELLQKPVLPSISMDGVVLYCFAVSQVLLFAYTGLPNATSVKKAEPDVEMSLMTYIDEL